MEDKKKIENCIQNLTDKYNVILARVAEDCSFRGQATMLYIKLDNDKLIDNVKELLTINYEIFDLQMMLKELENGEKSN